MRTALDSTRDVLALEQGEVVLWESKPSLRWVALSNAWLLVIGAVFSGGPIAMAHFTRHQQVPPDNWVFWARAAFLLLPFGCSGYLLARFAWLLQQARRTLYRITTKRLVCTTTAVWGYERHVLAVSELGRWKILPGLGMPGTVTLHELSRGEYTQWIRLIGVRDPQAALHALLLLQKGELAPIR